MRYLPYLLPWVRVLFLIRSITSTDWDDTTGRLVQPISAERWRCAGRSRGRAGGTRCSRALAARSVFAQGQ
jgi:hypothetical protein